MGFGDKLRAARREKGLTQKELAESLGVKHNSVSNWENGQNEPDLDLVRRICTVLGVSLGFLLDDPGPAAPDGDALSQLLSDTEFALLGAVRQLGEAEKQDILDFVRFKADQKRKRE